MVRGKLILICQCGGEFVKNDDGSLKYNGGEAQAVNIDSETLFDDLKLKLAELCNLDFKSVVVKYFLPGNTRTLINLSNDKELKRMLAFHGKSVTAEVFVTGTVGFSREALNLDTRDTTIRVAESANRVAPPTTASPVVSDPSPTLTDAATAKRRGRKKGAAGKKKDAATQKKDTATQKKDTDTQKKDTASGKKANPITTSEKRTTRATASGKKATLTVRSAKSKTPGRKKRKYADTDATLDRATRGTAVVKAPDDSDSDFSDIGVGSLLATVTKGNASTPVEMDMNANPADTVKKRRRIASSKVGGNVTAIATVPDDGMSKRSRKKKGRKRKGQSLLVDEELEEESKSDGDDDFEASFNDDGDLGKVVSSWKKGIRSVGQDFTDAAEFRDVLQKYALARRFVYKLKKNEATRVSARCVIESCTWKLLACWIPTDDVLRVKTFNKTHSCGGQSWKSAHPNRRMFVNFIREKLRNSPHQKVKDIANSLSRDLGLELNLSQVRRGINDAREQLQGSYQEAYNQLPYYCDQIAQANPMSVVKIETNEEKRLQRLFISFHASIHGFESGCRPLLFLEATSMKSKCKEKLLTATALDGNDGLFPVAFAIVDNEDNDSWRWFLDMLRSILPTTSGSLTFVSDREKGLKEVVHGVFGDAHIGYSIYHLLQRFMRSVKRPFQGQGRSSLPGYFIAAAQTIRFSVFKNFVEKIMKVSPEAYDWLMQVEPEYWASTSFKGESYNHITQNIAESYIKLMEEKRETTITHKLEALIYTMSELINSRRTLPTAWTSKLTPPKQEKLREEFAEARGLRVLFSSDTIFEVRDEVSHVVNLNITECTCLVWQRTGIPCRHAIAVFNCTNRNIYDFCSRYYTKDSYILAYSKSINLVDRPAEKEESEADAVLMLPPLPPRPWSSQPRKKLIKCSGNGNSQMEALLGAGPEVVGEGNLIASFDANGQVREHHELGFGANGKSLLQNCHEVAIQVDPIARLDSVVDVVCEVVNHDVAVEVGHEMATGKSLAAVDDIGNSSGAMEVDHEMMTDISVAAIDDTDKVSGAVEVHEMTADNSVAAMDEIGKDVGDGDYIAAVEAINEVSFDDNGEGKFEIDHDLFGDATYNTFDSNEVHGEASHEVDTIVNLDAFKTDEVHEEALDNNTEAFYDANSNESSYEANAKASLDVQRQNDDASGKSVE